MKKWRQLNSRSKHYVSLLALLLTLAGGGIITLNCTPSESIPRGRLEGDQQGVKRTASGGIVFDIENFNVNSATFLLPAEITVRGKPYDLTWESDNPKDAVVEGDVIATIYKNESQRHRTVRFIGRYIISEKVMGVSYLLNVSNEIF